VSELPFSSIICMQRLVVYEHWKCEIGTKALSSSLGHCTNCIPGFVILSVCPDELQWVAIIPA
jgi:hypothetical protein